MSRERFRNHLPPVPFLNGIGKPGVFIANIALIAAAAQPVFADSPPPLPENPALMVHAPKASGSPTKGELTGTADDPLVKLTYGGELTVTAQDFLYDRGKGHYLASGNPIVQELTAYLTAESIEFQEAVGDMPAWGVGKKALLVRSPYVIRADSITLDENSIIGLNAYFTTAPANVAPAYSIRAEKLTLNPKTGTGDVKNGHLYLFGTRFVTLKHYRFQYSAPGGGSTHRQFNRPNVGVSSRYGVFGSFDAPAGTWLPVDLYFLLPQKGSPQLRAIASQSLMAQRKRTTDSRVFVVGDPGKTASGPPSSIVDAADDTVVDTVQETPVTKVKAGHGHQVSNSNILGVLRGYAIGNSSLPADDPLLFYQFVPWPITVKPLDPHAGAGLAAIEQVSAHVATSGNEHNDLFVSRVPELGLSSIMPLTRVTARPRGNDPLEFRRYLRHPVLYFGSSATFGSYFEQPTNIRHSRWQYNAWINTSALLIGTNTVIVPRVLATYNHYDGGGRDGYRYAQGALSMMHYFTNRTAIGVDYSLSAVNGNSPFNFDVLDAAQELDARAQVGNKNIAIGGVVRTDVDHGKVFDYRVTVAPTVRGVIPIFTYDFLDKGVNVDVKFDGIEF